MSEKGWERGWEGMGEGMGGDGDGENEGEEEGMTGKMPEEGKSKYKWRLASFACYVCAGTIEVYDSLSIFV